MAVHSRGVSVILYCSEQGYQPGLKSKAIITAARKGKKAGMRAKETFVASEPNRSLVLP